MNISDTPKKQSVPFATNGSRENILDTTPAGDNTASYDAGFPAVTMIVKAAGGKPLKGEDMNQILYELATVARWASAGGGYQFDGAFATAVAGYAVGALVLATDGSGSWLNTVDSNTNNPESTASPLTVMGALKSILHHCYNQTGIQQCDVNNASGRQRTNHVSRHSDCEY